jgi:hypothetical protein
MNGLKLSDLAIAQIVQLVQMGILTGTDISDQIRTLKLDVDDTGKQLVPSHEFLETFNENLAQLEGLAEQEITSNER